MKKKAFILLPGVLLLLLPACTKDTGREEANPVVTFTEVPIRFSVPATGTKAEAALDNFEALMNYGDGIGLYGAYLAADAFPGDAGHRPVQLFHNIQTMRGDEPIPTGEAGVDENVWHTTPTIYWPNAGKVSFFAYAPYTATDAMDADSLSIVTASRYSAGEYPRLKFTPRADAKRQQDLLTGRTMDKTGASGEAVYRTGKGYVDLDLYHQLTWVDFKARVTFDGNQEDFETWLTQNFSGTGYRIGIASVTLSGVLASNTGTFTSGGRGFVWDDVPYDAERYNATYALSVSTGEIIPASSLPISAPNEDYISIVVGSSDGGSHPTENGLLYLLPQTLPASASLRVEFGIFKADTGEPMLLYTTYFSIGSIAQHVWGPGEHILYRMQLDLSTVSNSTITANVEDWTDAYHYEHGSYLE